MVFITGVIIGVLPLFLTSIYHATQFKEPTKLAPKIIFDGVYTQKPKSNNDLGDLEILIDMPVTDGSISIIYILLLIFSHMFILPAAEALFFYVYLYKFWLGYTGKIIVQLSYTLYSVISLYSSII